MSEHNKSIRVAVLDMYEGEPNEGMRCIRNIVHQYAQQRELQLTYTEFDVRLKNALPALDYDVYISTGGPGSPLKDKNNTWEGPYFDWLNTVESYNSDEKNKVKKHVLLICHSFQLACRYFGVGAVAKRKSTAFGVFPVHIVEPGQDEPIFNGLPDPFYAVENRDYQVIQPDFKKLEEIGASILAIEKERPHVPLERAVMALRFNDYMLGTQFHPEVEPEGMRQYLQREEKKERVIENHGIDKWESMLSQLDDPQKISWTYSRVIPNFLEEALKEKWRN
jgi:GMP synthase-like glutamine amidotransferase